MALNKRKQDATGLRPSAGVMVTRVRSLTILIALYAFSSSLYADVFSCNGERFNGWKLGDFGTIEYGEPMALEVLLQSSLRDLSKEAELMSKAKPLPSEAKSYIHDAIDLLERSREVYSCFAKNIQPQDVILRFKESGASEIRTGFVIMRSNKPVAYYYDKVANI